MSKHPNREEQNRFREARLTAYLLDELEAEDRAAVEAELAADPELCRELEALSATVALVRGAVPPARLNDERRESLKRLAESAAAGARPQGRLLAFRRAAAAAAVLLVVGGAVWFGAHGWESSETPRVEKLARTLKAVPSATAPAAPKKEINRAIGLGGGAGASARIRVTARKSSRFRDDQQILHELGYQGEQPLAALGYVSGAAGASRPAPPGEKSPQSPRFYRGPSDSPPPNAVDAGKDEGRNDVLYELGYLGGNEAPIAEEELEEPDRFQPPASSPAAPRHLLQICDGYGRCYTGRQVLDYLHRRPQESPRDMFFRYYGDNPFVTTARDAVSTFAADVDTASYPLARNYVVKGHLPPKAAVRTEEFLNDFKSELSPPKEGDFAIHLEYAPSLFGGREGVGLLKVGIKAREVPRSERKPLNLVFVIDSSGSMADGNRLELVKRALGLLVDQLEEGDQVGIVTFNSRGRRVLEPTPGSERWKIREAVRSLSSGGSTNAGEGLFLGYAMAEASFREGAVNRIILCSDGVANTGVTDQEKILAKVRASSEHQIDLTTIGVGMGNHNDVFLEQLADKGNGSCHYVDDLAEARRVFVEHFVGTLQTIARDVKIQVQFDPGSVLSWRQLGYENRALAARDFRNDAVDAGEVGSGHEVVALYELEEAPRPGEGDPVIATVRLRWFPDGADEAVEMKRTLRWSEATGRWGLASPRFRLSAVAAQFAEVLRRSYWARGDSYDELQAQADRLAAELSGDAQVRELRDFIARTRELVRQLEPDDELTALVDEARRMKLQEVRLEDRGEKTAEVEELLKEVRRRNAALERKILDLLAKQG